MRAAPAIPQLDVSALAPSLPALAAAARLETLALVVGRPGRLLGRQSAIIDTLHAMPSLRSVEFKTASIATVVPLYGQLQDLMRRAARACPRVHFSSDA